MNAALQEKPHNTKEAAYNTKECREQYEYHVKHNLSSATISVLSITRGPRSCTDDISRKHWITNVQTTPSPRKKGKKSDYHTINCAQPPQLRIICIYIYIIMTIILTTNRNRCIETRECRLFKINRGNKGCAFTKMRREIRAGRGRVQQKRAA